MLGKRVLGKRVLGKRVLGKRVLGKRVLGKRGLGWAPSYPSWRTAFRFGDILAAWPMRPTRPPAEPSRRTSRW